MSTASKIIVAALAVAALQSSDANALRLKGGDNTKSMLKRCRQTVKSLVSEDYREKLVAKKKELATRQREDAAWQQANRELLHEVLEENQKVIELADARAKQEDAYNSMLEQVPACVEGMNLSDAEHPSVLNAEGYKFNRLLDELTSKELDEQCRSYISTYSLLDQQLQQLCNITNRIAKNEGCLHALGEINSKDKSFAEELIEDNIGTKLVVAPGTKLVVAPSDKLDVFQSEPTVQEPADAKSKSRNVSLRNGAVALTAGLALLGGVQAQGMSQGGSMALQAQAHMPAVFTDVMPAVSAAVRAHTPAWWSPEGIEAARAPAPEEKKMLGHKLQEMLKKILKEKK